MVGAKVNRVRRGAGKAHRALVAALMVTTGLGVTAIGAAPAYAQSDARRFDIPAQPLATALTAFGQQSGLQVSAQAPLVEGKTSSALRGDLAALDALSRLLAGTGLTFRIAGSTVTLEQAPLAANDTVQLGTLRVEGVGGSGGGGSAAGLGSRFGDGGDTGDLAYRSPFSSSYITRDEIERNRGSQPSDIFRGTPGVLSGDSRNSGGLDLNIRGMQGMGRVPVVIDGAQHSTTVYRGYAGVASRTYVDPDMIGGIEIIKGPTSGADAVGGVGGVVRMRTINASDIVLPGRDIGIRIRGGFNTNSRTPPAPFTKGGLQTTMTGSFLTGCNYANCGTIQDISHIIDINDLGNARGFDRPSWLKPTGWNGSVAAAKVWRDAELVAAIAYRTNGNYFAGTHGDAPKLLISGRTQDMGGGRERYFTDIGFVAQLNRFRAGEEVLNTSSENLSFMVKATLRPFEFHSFEFGYSNYQSWFGELMPSSIIRGTGALQSPMSHIDLDTLTARYKWDPPSSLIQFQLNASRTELDNRIVTAYDFTDNPAWAYVQPYDARTHRNSIDISNRSEFDIGLGRMIANIGGAFSYETTYQIPDAPPTYSDGIPRDGWRREWSAFADLEWSPIDLVTFAGAIRYTQFESYDRKGGRVWLADEGRYSDVLHAAYNESGWAPTFSVTLNPAKWLQFYARYAEGIRMPSLFEVTAGWSQTPNPAVPIKPERARNWELGGNVSADGLFFNADALRLKVAYFDSKVKDYLTRSLGSGWADTVQMIRNIDQARFQGLETTLEYRQGPVKLELFATHYFKTDLCSFARRGDLYDPLPPELTCNDDLEVAYARNHIPPEWAGGGSVSLSLLKDRLNLFGRVTFTGRRPDSAINSPGSSGVVSIIKWSPYTLVDAQVSYKLNDHVRFELTGDNLTDKYYMDALTLGLMASPGRTVRAGVTLTF